jgi:hypothetical protein
MKDRESSKVIMSFFYLSKWISTWFAEKVHTLRKFLGATQTVITPNRSNHFQIKFAQLMYCLSPLIFHAQILFHQSEPCSSPNPTYSTCYANLPNSLRKPPSTYYANPCLHTTHPLFFVVQRPEGFYFVFSKCHAPIFMKSRDWFTILMKPLTQFK